MRSDELDNLSMQELFHHYTWSKGQWKRRRSTTSVVLRVFPRLSPNPSEDTYEDYCRVKMILHHPFRHPDALLRLDGHDDLVSWRDAYAQCITSNHGHQPDTLQSWDHENNASDEGEDDDEEINADLAELDEADWQIYARLFPNAAVPQFDLRDLGRRPIDEGWDIHAAHTRWMDVDKMATYLIEQRRILGALEGPSEELVRIPLETLEVEQRNVLDRCIDMFLRTMQGSVVSPLRANIDGTAGCGKTYLIRAICQELRRLAAELGNPEPVRVLAPSGVAAWNINGQTIHSALGIPASNGTFVPLTGSRLATLQQQWKHTYIVIIDEKSMLGQRLLAKIDSRLRQLKPQSAHLPFGGLHIAIIGDFAQLPPVGDRALYAQPSATEDHSDNAQLSRDGHTLYRMFAHSFRLQVVHRQNGQSPEQERFRQLLRHASSGGLTMDDWKLLLTRHRDRLPRAEQESFDDCVCLFTKTEAVNEANLHQLFILDCPCARIKAKHDGGPEAVKAGPDDAAGLEPELVLARGAKVMITRNIWQSQGAWPWIYSQMQAIYSWHRPRSCQRCQRHCRGHHLGTGCGPFRPPSRRSRLMRNIHWTNALAYRAPKGLGTRSTHCAYNRTQGDSITRPLRAHRSHFAWHGPSPYTNPKV